MRVFLETAAWQNNPLTALNDFLQHERAAEAAGQFDQMRFVGYLLDLGFDDATIITSDPFKRAVGGIPRGSFLILAPQNLDGLPPHFTLLRVGDVAPTPLSSQVQQTYFELHKRSMPELDIWTQSELQWGALKASVLGMFYPSPADPNAVCFSGDVNNVVSAHRYKVYSPNHRLLDLIINSLVRAEHRFSIGTLRSTECQLPLTTENVIPELPVHVSARDFRGFRTAMFGKTRLGKSNVVKLLASAQIETTTEDRSVGQLIFDIDGEYANDNPQDGNRSLRSAYEDRCVVYALTQRQATPSQPLRFNFYCEPAQAIPVIASFLSARPGLAQYVRSFLQASIPTPAEFAELGVGDRVRAVRRIKTLWAILNKTGFQAPPLEELQRVLRERYPLPRNAGHLTPGLRDGLREAMYRLAAEDDDPNFQTPHQPLTLAELQRELDILQDFRIEEPESEHLLSDGDPLFEPDAVAMLDFLKPASGGGVRQIREFIPYHHPDAQDFVRDVLVALDAGQTVILDLGNATDILRRYFADYLSKSVFAHQENKFVSDTLGGHFIQLYFEEAHNLFPRDNKELTDVYSRMAKEGAKFHIGLVYSTQSPSTISEELLAQTENFFVGHLSSQDETRALARVQVLFDGLQSDILRSRTPGFMRAVTFSHRFVVPIQTHRFEAMPNSVLPGRGN
jgi:hypothetical protein